MNSWASRVMDFSRSLSFRSRFRLRRISLGLEAEGDLIVLEFEDTVIGQSHAVGACLSPDDGRQVAAEVVKHGLGRPERLFRIDDPALLA